MTVFRRVMRYLVLPLAAITLGVLLPVISMLALLYIAYWWMLMIAGVCLLIAFWPFPDLEGRSMGNRNSGRGKRITITGGDFTFRTLHAPSQQNGTDVATELTLDKRHTVTMPAISGAEHSIVPTRRIRL